METTAMDGTRAYRKSVGVLGANFEQSPAYRELVPLRIPAGWTIGWNNLHRDKRIEDGDFGGSSVFYASNRNQRFFLDVEFRPEHDPEGRFYLSVEYLPWPRDARGRRLKEAPVAPDASIQLMHRAEIATYAELIEQLETWIARCTVWTVEGN
ncbi:hypothetical protein P6144_01860 [Sphingomonas sp. HITSZ_GF]|uniref:hypothetical protein n=1 Tax=Sphingomonas sp. HITSZ_GF TaxID=3037247 RepID=UPI00240CF8F7|nr:hypothetical protein [Sphingomonas sp. HITSZ_GF]MDG2532378.1 hypothetical protein [Sphingomonas sp. HITSZ_GF]